MTEQFVNMAQSALTAPINNTSNPVTFTVQGAAAFPTVGNFRVLIDAEIFLVTSVVTNTMTATRAAEGTIIAAHDTGAQATHILTAQSLATIIADKIALIPAATVPVLTTPSTNYWQQYDSSPYQLSPSIGWVEWAAVNNFGATALALQHYSIIGEQDGFSVSLGGWFLMTAWVEFDAASAGSVAFGAWNDDAGVGGWQSPYAEFAFDIGNAQYRAAHYLVRWSQGGGTSYPAVVAFSAPAGDIVITRAQLTVQRIGAP